MFISTLTYKANEKGILVIETEESYTSKASFLDRDDIPTYGEEKEKTPTFSGVRSSRGMYTSFKYGEFEGERNGRFFTDFTIETFSEFISDIDNIKMEEDWITGDVRPGRGEEKWLNLILRKC